MSSLFFGFLLACLGLAHAAPVQVVTTVPELAVLVREVGGERVQVTALALPTQDPHFVDARPNLALALSRADLLVVVGLELEVGWMPVLIQGARNPRIQPGAPGFLDASTAVTVLERATGQVDRSQGDVHGAGNPHYLLHPRNGPRVAAALAAALTRCDPAGAEVYRARLAEFEAHAAAAIHAWELRLAGLRGREVLQYHRSFVYLADWTGLRLAGEVEPKPGVPPTAGHLAQVIQRSGDVVGVLAETWFANKAGLVAEHLGVPLVTVGGPAADESWFEHWEALVAGLAVLGGAP